MGLKHFHILFIVLSVVVTLGFGLWAVVVPLDVVGAWGKAGGVFSLILGVILIVYGVWFLKKSKNIIT